MGAIEIKTSRKKYGTVGYENAADIITSDTVDQNPLLQAVYVGVGGNIKITMRDTGTVTLLGVPTGTVLRISPRLIFAIGTLATNLVALW